MAVPMPTLSHPLIRIWLPRMLVLLTVVALIVIGWMFLSTQGILPADDRGMVGLSVLALAIVAVIMVAAVDSGWRGGSYTGGLLASSVALPGLASLLTVLAYVINTGHASVWIGIVITMLLWPVLALFFQGFVTVQRANSRTYGELRERYHQLAARLNVVQHLLTSDCDKIAYNEARKHTYIVGQMLGVEPPTDHQTDGLGWVLSTGYINVWTRLHRAEEALIQVLPTEQVLSEALYDEWRIRYSNITSRDDLLKNLQDATEQLRTIHLTHVAQEAGHGAEQSGAQEANQIAVQPAAAQPAQAASAPSQAGTANGLPPLHEPCLRTILRQTRRTVNEYRDDRRDGLVRARNRLIKTGTMTGFGAYVLLVIAVLLDAPRDAIGAAVVFYLVGALVGLFNILRFETESDKAVEDFGLVTARMMHRPLFSGLAALGGVVLIALLPIALNPGVLAPKLAGASNVATTSGVEKLAYPLLDIFNLDTYPFGLVIAAVFGLTPTLLISRIEKATDKYKADLQSTEAADGAAKTPKP